MKSLAYILSVCLILSGVFSGVCYGSQSDGAAILNAAMEGDLNRIKELAAQGEDVNVKDSEGATVLHYAALTGQLNVVSFLVERGADVNAKDKKNGKSVLHEAVFSGNLELVKWLVQNGADVNAKTNNEVSVLHFAVELNK